MEKILTIIGPTASGKTSLAVESAKLLEGEVI
ncbi:MAG TPA: tRNA (adenosine(37)-N6)-dimethylallyltransferase MiaA, partial [Candidatus Marinimicrobia bacterium]|nr:tRNA (adenosine(37)-N6)-dimethylallyltransferase MiaA [Candidatus Neomarinimicrobiota bacterium]